MSLNDADLTSGLTAAIRNIPTGRLAVAVSGGGDSVALLHLLAGIRNDLQAVTVDHGLRKESADEAAGVAALCASLGVAHTILSWQDWDQTGNLQAAARDARYQLMRDWARDAGITHIALAHTLDDQAETFVLRLSRGSGVDGLSGMSATRSDDGITWVRPLLDVRRDDLRTYLTQHKVDWVDDPSNDDTRFDRIKIRKAMPALAELGLTTERLVQTAAQMSRARDALALATVELAKNCVAISEAGEVNIDLATFTKAPEDLRLRLMSGILQWMSGAPYRPRLDSVQNLLALEKDQTLHGCLIRSQSGKIIVRREPQRVSEPITGKTTIWDHRWQVDPVAISAGDHIAALGENGLAQCENWRESGHAREVLLTTPALWEGDRLIAAPLARMPNIWTCRLIDGEKGLHKVLMTR